MYTKNNKSYFVKRIFFLCFVALFLVGCVSEPNDTCLSDSGRSVEYTLLNNNATSGTANIVVRNNGKDSMSEWSVEFTLPENQIIDYEWNATIVRNGNDITVSCVQDFCNIPVGEAKSFGYGFSYSGSYSAPSNLTLHSASCSGSVDGNSGDNSDGNSDDNPDPLLVTDTFNYVLGTQTIQPKYQFTNDLKLIETAKQIQAMGSNLIKLALDPFQYDDMAEYHSYQYQFLALARDVPAFSDVLDMDFAYYMLWIEDSGSWTDDLGLSQVESDLQYQKMYELTQYLLETYNGSGKTFMLGNWEGDWNLLWNGSTYDDSVTTVNPKRIEGLVDWLNIRQKAVDDAKLAVSHTDVDVLHYVEVNRVLSAMEGKERITNKVLPFTHVDLVSYSAYDITTKEGNADYASLKAEFTAALDYIEAQLPEKDVPAFDKRVFIGEYGYASYWWTWDWGEERHKLQNQLAKMVMKVTLEWGAPFILYWQIYDNEYDSSVEAFKGFWMINDKNEKLPIYHSYQNFYTEAKLWVESFTLANGRSPTGAEYRENAITIVDQLPDVDSGSSDSSSDPATIKIWFLGDSITYGMVSLPFHTQGFRVQILDLLDDLAQQQSLFPVTSVINNNQKTISYNGRPIVAVGTVSGPSNENDIAQQTKNYWHSGFPGATSNDLLCFLDPSHAVPSGYGKSTCAETFNTFNATATPSCRQSVGGAGWLADMDCYLDQQVSANDAVVVPIQIGTNDITYLNSHGAIECNSVPSPQSMTAKRLTAVVDSVFDASQTSNANTIVGKIRNYLVNKGVSTNRISFVISMIPKRTQVDGADANNYCTDYYNALIQNNIQQGTAQGMFLANQGNLVPTADSVHPANQGHAIMACNLLYGYAFSHNDAFVCPVPVVNPTQGFMAALKSVAGY